MLLFTLPIPLFIRRQASADQAPNGSVRIVSLDLLRPHAWIIRLNSPKLPKRHLAAVVLQVWW